MAAAMHLGQLSRMNLFKGAQSSFQTCRHRLPGLARHRCFASAAADPIDSRGVSLIQGASRGLGLEFVSALVVSAQVFSKQWSSFGRVHKLPLVVLLAMRKNLYRYERQRHSLQSKFLRPSYSAC
jgi:hypothetical protein